MKNGFTRAALMALLCTAVSVLSGCVTMQSIKTKNEFAVQSRVDTGVSVTLLPVAETIAPDAHPSYKNSQKNVGRYFYSYISLSPLPVLPINIETWEWNADQPRVDIIRDIFLNDLRQYGMPVVCAGTDKPGNLPPDGFTLAVKLRKLQLESAGMMYGNILLFNAFTSKCVRTHVVMECTLWKNGKSDPVWSGTIDETGLDDSHPYYYQYAWKSLVGAVDKFVAASGLAVERKKIMDATYDKDIEQAVKYEAAGPCEESRDAYIHALVYASDFDRQLKAAQGVGRANKALGIKAVPDEAKDDNARGVAGVEIAKKQYVGGPAVVSAAAEATIPIHNALALAPWWPGVHLNLALMREIMQQWSTAIDEFKLYVALTGDEAEKEKARPKIAELELRLQQSNKK